MSSWDRDAGPVALRSCLARAARWCEWCGDRRLAGVQGAEPRHGQWQGRGAGLFAEVHRRHHGRIRGSGCEPREARFVCVALGLDEYGVDDRADSNGNSCAVRDEQGVGDRLRHRDADRRRGPPTGGECYRASRAEGQRNLRIATLAEGDDETLGSWSVRAASRPDRARLVSADVDWRGVPPAPRAEPACGRRREAWPPFWSCLPAPRNRGERATRRGDPRGRTGARCAGRPRPGQRRDRRACAGSRVAHSRPRAAARRCPKPPAASRPRTAWRQPRATPAAAKRLR